MASQSLEVYKDLNREFGGSNSRDLLLGKAAINQGLYNLFNTLQGEAAPIFEPDFGSSIPHLIHEPMDDLTTMKLEAAVFQAVKRWEPRVQVDVSQSFVDPDLQNMLYRVVLVYTIRATGEISTLKMQLAPVPAAYKSELSALEKVISLRRLGWPGIQQFCIVDSSGDLVASSGVGSTWGGTVDWTSFISWNIGNSTTMEYTAFIDHGFETPRRIVTVISDETNPQQIVVELATSSTGTIFTSFGSVPSTTVSSRYMKFRVTVVQTPGVQMRLTRGDLFFYI